MKTTFTKTIEFKPVTMTVVFESQKELDVYGSMFNLAPLVGAIEELGAEPIGFEQFEEAGANIRNTGKFLEVLMQTPYMKAHYKKI